MRNGALIDMGETLPQAARLDIQSIDLKQYTAELDKVFESHRHGVDSQFSYSQVAVEISLAILLGHLFGHFVACPSLSENGYEEWRRPVHEKHMSDQVLFRLWCE